MAPEREDKMGSVRDFVCENDITSDYLLEYYGEFYRFIVEETELRKKMGKSYIKTKVTFEQYYNEATKNKDEYCYKGVKNEV